LKHRVFEVSLADLQSDEDQAYRKIRLRAEDVQGRNVLTNFWVMILRTVMPPLSFFFCFMWLTCLFFLGYGFYYRQAAVAGQEVADLD